MKLSQVPKLKFGTAKKGTRAIKAVELPLVNSPGDYVADQPELAAQRAADGRPERQTVRLGIRALNPGEDGEVQDGALEYARKRGLENADDRNPIYSRGYNLHLLARACVDIEPVDDEGNPLPFDPENPKPFFGNGDVESAIAEILGSEHLTRDSITFLSEHQEHWQDAVAPQATKLSAEQLWDLALEVVTSRDVSPFFKLRLGTLLQFMEFLVNHCAIALTSSLRAPSDSSESKSDSESPADA